MFMSHNALQRFQGCSDVDSAIYAKIYEGEVPCDDLESVYQMFNLCHPEDFRGRSLSVSDVVEVLESEAIAAGFYFCDIIGFKSVLFDKTAETTLDCKRMKKVLSMGKTESAVEQIEEAL